VLLAPSSKKRYKNPPGIFLLLVRGKPKILAKNRKIGYNYIIAFRKLSASEGAKRLTKL
jgi:hypothetical protein